MGEENILYIHNVGGETLFHQTKIPTCDYLLDILSTLLFVNIEKSLKIKI